MEYNMDQRLIQISLTIENLNIIMAALGEIPYRVSSPVISSIQMQAQPQLQPPEADNDN